MTDKSARETTDLVEKCAKALAKAAGHATWEGLPNTEMDALKSVQDGATACCKDDYRAGALAVIDALADGVTDKMVKSLAAEARFRMIGEESDFDYHRRALTAAIRAAKTREG